MRGPGDKYRNLSENGVVGILWSTLSKGTVLEANRAMVDMFYITSFEGTRAADFYANPAHRGVFGTCLGHQGSPPNCRAIP